MTMGPITVTVGWIGRHTPPGAGVEAPKRIKPRSAALHRLLSCVRIEAHDKWQVSGPRYLSETSMALLTPPGPTALPTRPAHPEVIDTTQALTA